MSPDWLIYRLLRPTSRLTAYFKRLSAARIREWTTTDKEELARFGSGRLAPTVYA